ncbi:trigger factor [Neoroseomonas lacus]|uniref:Trigger factor n=1 Tax=Neoroseomonas lacus TaxID=287609 RepID=A0A917L0K5_9PROT|nr:trigger factor [Neoroseomonas lacus]GGJ38722.1 hypothetical protein GCM10011320_52930 [Neoroseomonas lacus]
MQVTETVHDALKRAYVITLPAAHIAALRDQRVAEIARSVPISGFRRGEAPFPAVMQRFGTSVLGEVVEQEVATAVRQLLADHALRPAQEPRIVVGTFIEGRDLTINVALEELPDVPLPDVTGIRVERLRAQPTETHLRQALARLADRHGTTEDVPPRPAAPGDILVCDLEGGLPVDLLSNGAGRGARAGIPGLPPTDWSIDLSPGLEQEITATGLDGGLPCLDLALRGTTRAGAFLRVFAARPNGLKATAGQVLTLCMRARILAGALPAGSEVRLGFNERSEAAFLRSLRQPAKLGAEEMRLTVPTTDNPTLAHARPVLEIGFKPGQEVDLTLRIGPARVFPGAEEPAALLFGGGSLAGQAIEIGGPDVAPGFSAQLEGLAPGETRVVEALLPANHAVTELAGQRARYLVTATALRRRRPLAQDDTLARAVGLADVAALEATVLRSLRREYDQRARLRLKAALLGAVAASADFPVPECLRVAELTQIWERVRAERSAGRADAADAVREEAALHVEYRALAERRVRLRLLIAEIARVHDLRVTEEEMAQAIRQDAARYPGQERQVLDFYRGNDRALEALRAPLLEEKVVDLLISQAAVSEREVSPEELGAAA